MSTLLLLALAAAPKASITVVKSSATVNAPAAARELKSQAEGLRDCFDLALKSSPSLKGELTLTLKAEPGAGVTSLTIDEDTVKDETLSSCASARLRTSWPSVKKAVTVHATYHFEVK